MIEIKPAFFGIALVAASIAYAFYKKKDEVGLALIVVLIVLLWILNQLGEFP